MKFYMLIIAACAFLAYVHSDACVQCHSKTEERCATQPLSILAKDCPTNNSLCYTRVLNGYTIRGCSSELDNNTLNSCNNELECLVCSANEGCNRLIFPQYRPKCLQCSGDSINSSCAIENHAYSKVCPTYKLGDKCYIRYNGRTGEGAFKRGCLSSAQANKQCVIDGNCYTCEGHGCNALLANDTLIPIARDGAITVMLSLALMLACSLFHVLL
ncbi:uncharacterized protein LOC6584488 [Drosophila mojavensis]|uniref:DUF753 domain-containing protein n=1 Tax=Drosophila mojavensis TaxID=7230 RepID=B4L4I2_DROMO|nr:uncharacterized protein LOC6584488 [Drosophila mojavensis]EDW07460.1 uncharacterized protein Dmoj_GI15766 [Drosophila mojavensis]